MIHVKARLHRRARGGLSEAGELGPRKGSCRLMNGESAYNSRPRCGRCSDGDMGMLLGEIGVW